MTSRECFAAACEHRAAERVPRDYMAHPVADARLRACLGVASERELLDRLGCDFYYLPGRTEGGVRRPSESSVKASLPSVRGCRWAICAWHGSLPEAVEEMIRRVIEAGRRVGTPTGIHVLSLQAVADRIAQGVQFIAIGSDLWMLSSKACEIASSLWPERAGGGMTRY